MRTIHSPELYRNMGFWNNVTQEAILDTTVAIGGAGGAGYMVGLEIARIGVQRFDIAGPEEFEDGHSQRGMGVRKNTGGRNKGKGLKKDVEAHKPQE